MQRRDKEARLYREQLLDDAYRPGYHFTVPDGNGMPGDPNGAFFADGRYHLMYLYRNEESGGFHWGHASSSDLLHWIHHPDALVIEAGDEGCFSGGGFLDDDGTAYLSFWKFRAKDAAGDAGGIAIAWARPPYDTWQRMPNLAVEGSRALWGTAEIGGEIVGCADPSNIWKRDGWYYLQTGNLCVLEKYGRAPDAPEKYRGDWTELFRSRDLKTWEYVHRFYRRTPEAGEDWPDDSEDDMCPSFLPLPDRCSGGALTDSWLQLFIAHNKGAQYYIGRLDGETFRPERHGRFSWVDSAYFAPEALIDDRNRHVVWAWLRDNPDNALERFGWTGVYSFPRCLWLEDGALRMAPAQELDQLQYGRQFHVLGTVRGEAALNVADGASFRIRATIDLGEANRAGFVVREDAEAGERTEIYYDRARGALVMDTRAGGREGWPKLESAPLNLAAGEPLSLDVFVDRSVVEVYANQRQAICRRVFPTNPAKAVGVRAMSDGARFVETLSWGMERVNPY